MQEDVKEVRVRMPYSFLTQGKTTDHNQSTDEWPADEHMFKMSPFAYVA